MRKVAAVPTSRKAIPKTSVPSAFKRISSKLGVADNGMDWERGREWCKEGCDEEIEVLIDRSHENLIKTDFSADKKVEFAVADFPGWEVEIDGFSVDKKTGEDGNIVVDVPQGSHLVGVILSSSNVRWWSDLVSFLSLMVFIYLSFELRKEEKGI